MTVKAVLNPRRDEAEFYNSIVTPTDVILRRGEGVDVMEVDKDILEEAAAAASFAQLTGVFDKTPDAESPHLWTEQSPKNQIHLFQMLHLISWRLKWLN